MNTYNRANLLKLALFSYLGQTEKDFEIVIADDGSTDNTSEVIDLFKKRGPFQVKHVWQEHKGHRRAAILNQGIKQCSGDYILFTDCDSLAMRNLVEIHKTSARKDRLLCGGYVRICKEVTEAITEEDVLTGDFERFLTRRLKMTAFKKHLKAQWQILIKKPRRPHNMGLNFSVSAEALSRVNGYDEYFEGWGSADGDLRERLRMIKVTPTSLYNTALVLHMWHPTEKTKLNKKKRTRNKKHARRSNINPYCSKGIKG